MKRFSTLIALSVFSLSACGTTTVIREVAATTTTEMAAAPVVNKYDQYYEHVLNNSGQANTMGKDKVIEFGDLVCATLDNGNSIGYVVELLSKYAKTQSDNELFASVVWGAVTYLCSEYKGQMDAYLGANT
jgi:hypothetical protein